MKIGIAIIFLLAFVCCTQAQQVQCQTTGSTTTCTNWNAIGENIGSAMAVRIAAHRQESFCFKNQDQPYQGTPCSQILGQVVAQWVANHPKFRVCTTNSNAITDYIDKQHLNPWSYHSYDKAFGALKKIHAVELNK